MLAPSDTPRGIGAHRRFVATPHGRLAFRVLSAADRTAGPPVVALHGASGNASDWAAGLAGHLAGMTALAFDRPGMGRSEPAGRQPWRLAPQREAMRAALHALGHRRYVLVGHSFSGALALDWALAHPQEVAGLVLLSGAAMDWGGALEGYYRFAARPIVGPLMARAVPHVVSRRKIERALACIFAPQTPPERYAERAEVHLALRPGPFLLNARAMNALHGQIVANQPHYDRIACPTAILHGEADRVVPAEIHAVPLSRVLPDARLQLLPGIGHMPHHAVPQTVAAAIRETCARAGTRAQTPQRQSAGPSEA